jgi:hypothetical protein
MPECEYCEESFGAEDEYLDHLAAEHEGDLGAIDRRRVQAHEDESSSGLSLGPAVLLVLLVLSGVLVVWVAFFMGGDGPTGPEQGGDGPRAIPDDPLLADAESFESQGTEHVSAGTDVDYERVPPLSGPHYAQAARPGFAEVTPPLGRILHSLEHGHVVIYYAPNQLTTGASEDLRNLTATYTEPWSAVSVVPNPTDDPAAAYVLTAWQVRLRMGEYDKPTVRAFLDAFRGRGPENPVR